MTSLSFIATRCLPALLVACLTTAGGCGKPTPAPAKPAANQPSATPSTAPATAQPATPQPTATAPGSADAPAVPQPPATAPTAAVTLPTALEGSTENIEFLGLSFPVPEGWQNKPPTSGMRLANLDVPGADGGTMAEFVVFYFGPGQGGGVQANIDRWAGQFRSPDGGAVTPKIERTTVSGLPVTLVELSGAYQGMGMPSPKPDQLFLAAIIEAPAGSLFTRLVGDEATVEANREAFRAMTGSLRPATPG